MSNDRQQNEHRRSEEARRRLRGRNLAVLAALAVMVVLVYLITMARLEQGTERALEQEGEAQSSFAIAPEHMELRT